MQGHISAAESVYDEAAHLKSTMLFDLLLMALITRSHKLGLTNRDL